jgi:uncharacterized protein YbbC (DUF1343 family)
VLVTDRNALDAPELGLEIASALHHLYPEDFQIEKMKTNLANQSVIDDLIAGHDPQRIAESWRSALDTFEQDRQKALLYPSK